MKKIQAKWLYTTFVFWQWFMINIFLWSSADVRIDMSSWFAIDQMYFPAFNLNFHKISWVDYRREDKIISYNLLTSMLGAESFSKSDWLTEENQKRKPTSPQIPAHIGQKHQADQPKSLFFLSLQHELSARIIWEYFTWSGIAVVSIWEIGVA